MRKVYCVMVTDEFEPFNTFDSLVAIFDKEASAVQLCKTLDGIKDNVYKGKYTVEEQELYFDSTQFLNENSILY